MLKSEARKFIFVHIQKTGGSSLKLAIKTRVADSAAFLGTHDFARAGKTRLGEAWNDYFTCAIVRNPWARLVSWYSMLRRASLMNTPHLTGNKRFWRYVQLNARNFEDFVVRCTAVIDDVDGRKSIMFNQLDYVSDEDGQVIVSFIGRFERIQHDAPAIFRRIGLGAVELPHKVKSTHRHYSEYYTPALRDLVGERYEKDIIHFGYQFQEAAAALGAEAHSPGALELCAPGKSGDGCGCPRQ